MKARSRITATIVVALLLLGCGGGKEQPSEQPPQPTLDVEKLGAALEALPDSTIDGMNRFAWRLFGELAQTREEENLLLAPAGLYTTLTMAYLGTGHVTKQQFEQVLHLDTTLASDSFNVPVRELLRYMNARDDLQTVTREMQIGERIMLLRGYEDRVERLFGTDIHVVTDVTMVLDNNVDVTAPQAVFSAAGTAPFTLPGDSAVGVEMLMTTQPLRKRATDTCTALLTTIPIEGRYGVNLFFLLPEGETTLANLAQQGDVLTRVATYEPVEGAALLPQLELNSENLLNEPLTAIGLERAFTVFAEFPNMTENDLVLERLQQEISVELKGSKTKTGEEQAAFRVDRPFLLIVQEQPTGMILMIGAVSNPEPTGE